MENTEIILDLKRIDLKQVLEMASDLTEKDRECISALLKGGLDVPFDIAINRTSLYLFCLGYMACKGNVQQTEDNAKTVKILEDEELRKNRTIVTRCNTFLGEMVSVKECKL